MEALLEGLLRRLREAEAQATDAVLRGLSPDQYHRMCGRVEMIREMQNSIIPETIKDLRKDD